VTLTASQARAGMIAHDPARREDLVRDFIIAASKTYGDAIGNNEPKMAEIVDLYAMVNRMRVLGMRKTTACADVVMRSIIDTYFGPNRTVADLRELVRTGQAIHAGNCSLLYLFRVGRWPDRLHRFVGAWRRRT
jgi:hypothetical protein